MASEAMIIRTKMERFVEPKGLIPVQIPRHTAVGWKNMGQVPRNNWTRVDMSCAQGTMNTHIV